jgi:hypothetical protein
VGFGGEPIAGAEFRNLMKCPVWKKYKPKIVLGGSGAWQIVRGGMQDEYGIDAVVVGESDCDAVEIFNKVMNGEPLPKIVKTEKPMLEKIPTIKKPALFGVVEITRGCGKGCQFCSPTMRTFYSVENIEWYAYTGLSSWGTAKAYGLAVVTYDENTNSVGALNWENAENSNPYVLTSTLTRSGAGFLPVDGIPEAPSEGAILSTPFIVSETRSVAVLPISASIGVAMGFMVFAVWIGYRRMWGDAASTLLEQGFHDMTVRDVEIVGQIMDLKEFTIPELVRRTRASKITVWRTVQKLVEQGLVRQIEQTKPASNGLGGRGKPSRVYKYVGTRA